MRRARGTAVVGAALALVATVVTAGAANGAGGDGTSGSRGDRADATAASRTEATVTVDGSSVIGDLPRDFIGLSFEKSILGGKALDPSTGNLTNLLTNLSRDGRLRFGGNMMDESTWWQAPGAERPEWAKYVVDRQRADALNELSRRSGWKIEMATNLRKFDQQSSRDEARYMSKVFGNRLVGTACGNEIDLFQGQRDWSVQRPFWEKCADTISPYVDLIGGEEADGLRPDMLKTVGNRLTFASSHFYAQYENCFPGTDGPMGRKGFKLTDMLQPAAVQRTRDRLNGEVAKARAAGLSYRLTESNSAACLRQPEVGNVYAAALWNVDHLMLSAQLGVDGVNIHVPWEGWRLCSDRISYTPVCARTQEELERNQLVANPVYYGMLTAASVKPGAILPTKVSTATNTTAHTVRAKNGDLQVVLVQKDAPGGGPVTVRLDGVKAKGNATTRQLTAPSYTDPGAGITFSGARVKDDGTFTPGRPGKVAPKGGGYTLEVPTGSATVITIPGR